MIKLFKLIELFLSVITVMLLHYYTFSNLFTALICCFHVEKSTLKLLMLVIIYVHVSTICWIILSTKLLTFVIFDNNMENSILYELEFPVKPYITV